MIPSKILVEYNFCVRHMIFIGRNQRIMGNIQFQVASSKSEHVYLQYVCGCVVSLLIFM